MLYRFQLELSDIDRGVYQSLDFRVAQHPSETAIFLLTRVFAYALSYEEGLEFAPGGLADPDAPALRSLGVHNAIDMWIEIGNTSPRKLHKAGKLAKRVIVYTYKSAEALVEEIRSNNVHRADEIQIFAFDPKFLQKLEPLIEKNNRWSVLLQQGQLDVTAGPLTASTEVKKFSLAK